MEGRVAPYWPPGDDPRCLISEVLLVHRMLSQEEPGCSSSGKGGNGEPVQQSEDVWRFSAVKVVVVSEVKLRQLEPGGRNQSRYIHLTFKTRLGFFFLG